MKLLLFSDLHVNKDRCMDLVALSNEADLVIGAGDFGSLRMGVGKTIKWLSAIRKPAVLVPGNSESYHELRKACAAWGNAIVLHGSSATVAGLVFFGIGGGIPVTPFGPWSWDFTEQQAEDLLADCPEKCILVTHSPPYGMVDLSSSGQHLGSRAILNAVKSKKTQLVVCGHIHESAGYMENIGNTTVINAGPKGLIFEIS
jgi:Icc-related predicted phosphoesterase